MCSCHQHKTRDIMSKTPVSYSRRNFIESFKRKYPTVDIQANQVQHIIDRTGKEIARILLEDGELKMGSRLGNLLIRKFKPKGKGGSFIVLTEKQRSVDKLQSFIQKRKVYQFNDHSDGYIFKFVWNKQACKSVADKNMWIFKPIRSIKRQLAQVIKQKLVSYPLMIDHRNPNQT